MREIEFRGRMVTGEWVYGDLTHDLPDSTVYYKDGITCRIHWQEESARCNAPVIDKTVGQYTDLKDKNNTEIYTGDILKLIAEDAMFTRQEWMGVVEFGNPNGTYTWGFQLRPLNGAEVNPDILLWVETELPNVSCEIIGNIYENQELLKGGK